ncbi:Lrp/AsnC family transcriptional regulator [Geomicrobium sp. JCM 19039]|uniref:Lrp/AsnC family transcriptional regulator n=1 Tax=Geomicrobium sp. JCM 19039 TaxID=1460636 RepID=UPI00045F1721|nr:Lrp/AsnC family transcriptional regulator [Geomicrobium sp. JCM 19039]GAK14612.1 transcriptional regulator, AsnC family [Geomicrobium sp. JCM 19039]
MLDHTDYQILDLLKRNARLTYTDIGKQINMSSPAVKTRIERLEDNVIKHYTVEVNNKILNKGIHGFVLFKTESCERLTNYCKENSNITDLWRISGEYNYLAEVVCEKNDELEQISKDTTHFAFSNILSVLGSYNVCND